MRLFATEASGSRLTLAALSMFADGVVVPINAVFFWQTVLRPSGWCVAGAAFHTGGASSARDGRLAALAKVYSSSAEGSRMHLPTHRLFAREEP